MRRGGRGPRPAPRPTARSQHPGRRSPRRRCGTTKKIIKISKNNNYGKVKLINLFALISSKPEKLFNHKNPVGYLNNNHIYKNLKHWSENKNCDLWLGWGNKGKFLNRNKRISKKIMQYNSIRKNNFDNPLGPLLIKKTIKDNPIHPLYCSDNSILKAVKTI